MNDLTPPTLSAKKLAYSREESAALLGLSTVTLDRLVRRRLIIPSRATRRPIFSYWELERFLRETAADVGDTFRHGHRTSPPQTEGASSLS